MHGHADILAYQQDLLIKSVTKLFCTECWETQVATSCLIDKRKLPALVLTPRSNPTTSATSNQWAACGHVLSFM